MGVVGDLLSVEDHEHGGETAFDRLDYQTCWGIARVVELHSAPGSPPYAVAFEFHEDIAEVDDVANPTFLRLYQLKTKKSGSWTLSTIAKPTKTSSGNVKLSFAGRMHVNLKKFDDITEKVVFVSNLPLSEAGGTVGEFHFELADDDKLEKFLDAMKAESSTFSQSDDLHRFRFLECGLHLSTYESTVVGKIALFLANEIDGDVNAKQFYLTLGFRCRERTKNLADLTSIEELVASKFITRASISADLEKLQSGRIRRPQWETVSRSLAIGHHRDERELRDAWFEYEMTQIARATPATRKLADHLRGRVTPIINSASTLLEGAVTAGATVRADIEAVLGPRSEKFSVAAALYEYSR